MLTQNDKGTAFRALHAGPSTFLLPNAWDGGSARVLAKLGFPALATSSGACAGTLGRRDGQVSRDETLSHARIIVSATHLPVSADLERGFGDRPEIVAETIRMAAEAGLVGASIEDSTPDPGKPVYDRELAIERIAAAAEAARSLKFPFTLTARSENFIRARPDLDDTIARLKAFEKAGADVLFAPGLPDVETVARVCAELTKPVNFMVGIRGRSFSVAQLSAAGVRRISFATSLYRVAMTGLVQAANEVIQSGTFTYLDRTLTTAELNAFMPE